MSPFQLKPHMSEWRLGSPVTGPSSCDGLDPVKEQKISAWKKGGNWRRRRGDRLSSFSGTVSLHKVSTRPIRGNLRQSLAGQG